jgi:hypothetical protein
VLTGRAILEALASSSSDRQVLEAAGGKITDQFVQAVLACQDPDKAAGLAAIRRLSEPAVLADVAKGLGDEEFCRAATEKLIRWENGHRYTCETRDDALHDFEHLRSMVKDARELGRPAGGRHGYEVLRWSWTKDGSHHHEVLLTCSQTTRPAAGGFGAGAPDFMSNAQGREISDFARGKLRAKSAEPLNSEDYRRGLLATKPRLGDYFRLESAD